MSFINQFFSKLIAALRRKSVRGFLWVFGSRTLRIFIQAAYFILLTRGLGVQEYGLFMGILALMKLAFPFASWGGPQLLVKNVSRDRSLLKPYWGNALCLSLITGSACILLSLLAAHFIFLGRVSLATVFWIALAELFFARFFDLALKSFMAIGQLHRNAQLGVINSLNNLLAALCLVLLFDTPSAFIWSVLYAISRLLLAAVALGMIWPYIKGTRLNLSIIRKELLEGFYFSIGLSSQTVYNDVDKTMLSRLATLEATGIYGAAYRLLDIAMTPIMTALVTVYARFFREGTGGIKSTFKFAKQLLPFAGLYGLLASGCLLIFAPVVPLVLGDEYAASVSALRWLSPIVFFKTFQYFAADTLTGAGYQNARSGLQIGVAIFNVVANLWLIPIYSWKGAIWSSLMSDALLTIGLWGLVMFFNQTQLNKSSQPAE
ncbi:MAG: oligosaccharide flippase family protein [Cyanobacteria bacterium J06632_3]